MIPAARLLGLLLLGSAAGCSPLKTFNAVVPKDSGVIEAVHDAAFGSDPRQRLDVYAAPRGQARPIIVFLYGGSWNSGTKAGYGFAARAFAARGFVVAVPDYRLVPQVTYPAFLEDNAAAVRWVRMHAGDFGGDRDRIVLVGHSAGAYDAAMLALDPRWLGADRAAIRGWAGLAGPYDFAPFDQKVTIAAFGNAADPAQTQPISFASTDDPPTLLATGSKDTLVLPRNSDVLGHRLMAAGVPVTRLRYPRVGHIGMVTALAKPLRGKASVLDDTAAFAHRVTALP